jgi:recombination protein RecA
MQRVTLKKSRNGGGNYFAAPAKGVQFCHSGCVTLNCTLGGGWAEERVINIVGDKSSGKTLLCIEASANFALAHPKAKIYYREAESAFDREYARALGMPIDRIDFNEPGDMNTVEDFYNDLLDVCRASRSQPALYILDSLDALSDEAELARAIDAKSYGTKAKKMSELFRRLIRELKNSKVTLIIVSQVRDKIGILFGDKVGRTGGKALDFYASQVLYLSHLKTIIKKVGVGKKLKRVTGIRIRARLKKSKVGLPLRECEFVLKFGWGIDDENASADFLASIGIKKPPTDKTALDQLVIAKWYEIERSLLPTRKKYS